MRLLPVDPAGGPWRGHPAVLSRRLEDWLLTGVAAAVPLLVALRIALKVPDPNFLLAGGAIALAIGLIALAASARYEVSLTILALYLGLVDGVVKLETASQAASVLRDVMIASICIGALVRMVVRHEKFRLPPLSGWVIAFVTLTLVEAFNPNTLGLLKIFGGFRQQLEWIPFFFFGYLLMRSKDRFRKLFLLLGVIALLNGAVSAYQTQLTPEELSSWGPGYAQRISGSGSVSGRVYTDSEGKVRVRPPALGSDFGFGGYVGVLALPGLLVLLSAASRHRAAILILCLGALLAVATSLQRTAVLGAVAALAALALLVKGSGRPARRVLAGILVVGAITAVLAAVLAPAAGNAVFSRYSSITPGKAATTSTDYRAKDLSQIPDDIAHHPLGAGLSIAGAGASFGGDYGAQVNGKRASAESQYNYVTLELGLPGLLLWIALSLKLISLAVSGTRRIADGELRLYLAAVFAALIAFTIMGFAGPTMSSLPFGPYFWFVVGIASYWFAGGLQRQPSEAERSTS
jgi:hypothetical protein